MFVLANDKYESYLNYLILHNSQQQEIVMSYQLQEVQIARLRQILFPRKVKSTRSSLNTSIDDAKQNIQINHTQTIKQQIVKLKQQIQIFMDKQPLSCNFMCTPRQCYQLIKCMGNNMTNYGQQIEQAVKTLIESIPPPLTGSLPSSKYFLMQLKLNYFYSLIFTIKRKILGNCFQEIKKNSLLQLSIMEKQQQNTRMQQEKFRNFVTSKLFFGFNRWRINVTAVNKEEVQANTYEKSIVNSIKTIKLMAEQSKMVLWLQKLVQSNANLVQILLYNQKTATLRSYKLESQSLASVFQSVQNQSRISILDESFHTITTKIKRLQINLQHSLTKICLIKKQTLSIEQLRKDPDYSKIDQYSSIYGMSARQLPGGCIFTPIVYQNRSIGLIRQYFYDRIGETLKAETVSMIADSLESNIKTSVIFQQIRQKTLAIRNKYYLKAILLLNFLQKIQIFSANTQQQFDKLLLHYFPIKSLGQYLYQSVSTLDKFHSFTVTQVKGSETDISSVITALNKMNQSQSTYIYEGITLYIKLTHKIFQFQVQKQETNQVPHIPIQIIKQILQKKQIQKEKKDLQYKNSIQLKQIVEKQSLEKQIACTKNKILEFMLSFGSVESGENIVQILKEYLERFVYGTITSATKPQIVIINKNHNKPNLIATPGLTLYQDEALLVTITNLQNSSASQIEQHTMTSLIDLTNFLMTKLKKPITITFNTEKLNDLSQICYQMDSHEKSMNNLLANWLSLPIQQIQVLPITKTSNPFISQSYFCWLQKKYSNPSPIQNFIKCLKTYSTLEPTGINPLSTVLCLSNQMIILINRYLQFNQQIIKKLQHILQYWNEQKHSVTFQQKKIISHANIVKGLHRCNSILFMKKFKSYFYNIKNAKILYRYIPNIFVNYIKRQNCKCLHYALNCIKNQMQKKLPISMSKIEQKLSKLTQIFYNRASTLFQHYTQQKLTNKKLSNLTKILSSKSNINLQLTFNQIYLRKYLHNINNLSTLQQIFTKRKFYSLILIKRFSKMKSVLETTLTQTECSVISKLDNLTRISNIIKQKFYNFQAFLHLKNGCYLSLSAKTVEIKKQLEHGNGFEHYQFGCQPKSPIKYVVWLIPNTHTISLIQKHYLQVLSKAIDEGFMKFIYRNEELMCSLSHFASKKTSQLMKMGLYTLRQLTMQNVKSEQYTWRDCYYQTNLQVQNYKIIQKQQKRQQQQRINQIKQTLQSKNTHEDNLSNYRKTIIRLDISSRHLEQIQSKSRTQLIKKDIHRIFNIWRVESAIQKRYTTIDRLTRKKHIHALLSISNTINKAIMSNLNLSFKMLLVQSAQTKARMRSISQKRNIQISNQNRLITFQDEPNQFMINCEDIAKESIQQKQINIIPISFKHFQSSQTENYDVTAEQARKFNGGAYKLNAKTLKFLKRMGKLSN